MVGRMSREEQFEAGQASAIPKIRELEAKNAELEKKLDIAVDGLAVIESYGVSVSVIAREALAAIKEV